MVASVKPGDHVTLVRPDPEHGWWCTEVHKGKSGVVVDLGGSLPGSFSFLLDNERGLYSFSLFPSMVDFVGGPW